MESIPHILSQIGFWLGFTLVWLLCAGGLVLSCLSISGTWAVVAATILAGVLTPGRFPGVWTALVFVVLSVLVELIEWFAGSWGVTRRGGSKLAGFMALVGGILGLFAGAVIPIPVVGSLIGMLVFSFLLVFVVERNRLRHDGAAAHIAMGAVVARVLVILVKVGVTTGMVAALIVGMIQ